MNTFLNEMQNTVNAKPIWIQIMWRLYSVSLFDVNLLEAERLATATQVGVYFPSGTIDLCSCGSPVKMPGGRQTSIALHQLL